METILIDKLSAYVNSLKSQGTFIIFESIGNETDHMGAIIADAILQANLNYKTIVEPRVKRIINDYPNAATTSAALKLLQSIPTTEFLNWKGKDRADRFDQLTRLFSEKNIETKTDLANCFTSGDADNFVKALRLINGIGPKTVDYLKIWAGLSESAIDRRLLNFLEEAGIHICNNTEAQELINLTADDLKIDRAVFDHSIWQYMGNRPTERSKKSCKTT